jgi:outer membrane protein assembly factor BamD (BamD/ComL family)
MFFRPTLLVLLALGANQAPLQCSRDPDDPEAQRYETPPEALYDLASRFKERGDAAAWQKTLDYLVERYPNSRFAARARSDLTGAQDGAPHTGSGAR